MSERCEECGYKTCDKIWVRLDDRCWCSEECFNKNTKQLRDYLANRVEGVAYQRGWIERGTKMDEDNDEGSTYDW